MTLPPTTSTMRLAMSDCDSHPQFWSPSNSVPTMPSFPGEIIQSIVQELPTPSEQAKMCLVSAQFKAMALPVLYRHINIRSLAMAIRCCLTIAQCAGRGDYVRSFVVVPDADAERLVTSIEYRVLSRMLHLLPQLEYLHIWIPTYKDDVFYSLLTVTFPRLRRFACHQPHFNNENLLGDFLHRHPALTELCIIRPHEYQCDNPPTTSNEFATPLPLVPLPALQSYSGSYSYFLRLAIRNRSLTHATFWDIPRSTDRRDILVHRLANALAQASQLGLKLCILGDAFGAEAIPALARVHPHLRTLEIGPFLEGPSRLHPNAATAISSCLPHLPFLTTLNLNNSADLLDPSRPPTEGRFAQQDAAMLAAWSQLCPTLVASRLHNQYWQRAPGGAQWFMLGR